MYVYQMMLEIEFRVTQRHVIGPGCKFQLHTCATCTYAGMKRNDGGTRGKRSLSLACGLDAGLS